METVRSRPSVGFAALLGVLVGVAVVGYALLLVPLSLLGAAWVAAIGLSLVLASVFATGWARERFGLSARGQRNLSVGFAGLAFALLVAFIGINGLTVEAGSAGER